MIDVANDYQNALFSTSWNLESYTSLLSWYVICFGLRNVSGIKVFQF